MNDIRDEKEVLDLAKYGIECSLMDVNEQELIKQGYHELPKATWEKLNMLVQNMPGQIAVAASRHAAENQIQIITKDAYTTILKEGERLAKSKGKPGAYKGLVFTSQKGLATHADWTPIADSDKVLSKGPDIALGLFNVMSVATGQYYLAQINNKLDKIQTGISDILEFLESDKKSELIAHETVIKKCFSNLSTIMENDLDRQSSSGEIKRIITESMHSINLCREQIDKEKKKLWLKEKPKVYNQAIEQLSLWLPLYWYAVRNYIAATVLDQILVGKGSANDMQDLKEVVEEYRETYEACKQKIIDYVNQSEALNPSSLHSKIQYHQLDTREKALGAALGYFSSKAYDFARDKYAKAQKKKAKEQQTRFLDSIQNAELLEESLSLLVENELLRRVPVELVYTEDKAFIKWKNEEIEKQ